MIPDDFANLRASVHSVLVTFKDGASESQFCNVYRQCNGEAVPLQRYGFGSVREMMIACQDVVNIICTANGIVLYKARVLGITKDLQDLVKRTKSTTTKKLANYGGMRSSASSTSYFRGNVAHCAPPPPPPRMTVDWNNVVNNRAAVRPQLVGPFGYNRPTRPSFSNQPIAPPTVNHPPIQHPSTFANHTANANAQRPNPVMQNVSNGAVVPANLPKPPPSTSGPSATTGRVFVGLDTVQDVFRVRILEIFHSNMMIVDVELDNSIILFDYIKLLGEMLAFYKDSEEHKSWFPKCNQFVAVSHIGMWFRGAVFGRIGYTMSTVLLCDIGKLICVENNQLRRLNEQFLSLRQRSVMLKIPNALSIPINDLDKDELLKELASVVGNHHLEAKLPTGVKDSFFGSREVISELAFAGWTDVDRIPAVIKKYCRNRKDGVATAVRALITDAYKLNIEQS